MREAELANYRIDFSVTERRIAEKLQELKRVAERGSETSRREVVQAFVQKAIANWKSRQLAVYFYDTPWAWSELTGFNEQASLPNFLFKNSLKIGL